MRICVNKHDTPIISMDCWHVWNTQDMFIRWRDGLFCAFHQPHLMGDVVMAESLIVTIMFMVNKDGFFFRHCLGTPHSTCTTIMVFISYVLYSNGVWCDR